MKPIIFVVGTRAEALKLVPVYLQLQRDGFSVQLCTTYQHSDMIDQVFDVFDVTPDANLDIMQHDQDLFHINSQALLRLKEVYLQHTPQLVMVHGDTTTTMAAALAAFYLKIPVAHVEAGLRTGNLHAPFPEEMNRRLVGQIASYHFAPTALATAHLFSEGVPHDHVFCTGNTIVDALLYVKDQILQGNVEVTEHIKHTVVSAKAQQQKIVLFTAHRRESFNGGLDRIFDAVISFAQQHPDVTIIYPTHPNPNVQQAVARSRIREISNIVVIPHMSYIDVVYTLLSSHWVVTDSGGIQEEAVSMGRRVICLRDVTERREGVWDGSEVLVGTNKEKIFAAMTAIYEMDNPLITHSTVYGDGQACHRISTILQTDKRFHHYARPDQEVSFAPSMKRHAGNNLYST